MNVYRTTARTEATGPTYDYSAALEKRRRSVVYNSLRYTVWLTLVIGVYPFVALFGSVGWVIGLAAFGFVAVPLAIREARTSAIDAFEERLRAKAQKRSHKKRR